MRPAFFFAGTVILLVAWIGPLPRLAHQAFFGHMIIHMLNVALAAPLLSFAIAGSCFDPVNRFPKLFAPIPASVVELIIVWGWHAPLPHHAARHTAGGLAAEQSMFLLSGIWVWLSAFGGTRRQTVWDHRSTLTGPQPAWNRDPAEYEAADREKGRRAAGIIGLLLTSMHMTLLGALLGLAPRSVYANHDGFGALTALEDQQLGGAIMLVGGGVAYLSGGLWLTASVLRGRKNYVGESAIEGGQPGERSGDFVRTGKV